MTFPFQAHRQEKLRANKPRAASDGASTQHNAGIKLGARKDIGKQLGRPMPLQRIVSLGNKSGFPTSALRLAGEKSGNPTGRTGSINSIDFDSIAERELGDVLAELGKEHRQHKGKHDDFIYAEAGKVAAVAVRLTDAKEWRRFCKPECWEEYGARYRPKISNQKRLPFYVYLYVFDPGAEARAVAHERYPAVEYLLTKKVPAIKIASTLKRNGGFSGVDKKRQKKQIHQTKQKSDLTI